VLTVVPGEPAAGAAPGEDVVSADEVRRWVRTGAIAARVARYGEARLIVPRVASAGRPLPLALAARAMSRGRVRIEDARGGRREISLPLLAKWTGQLLSEPLRARSLVRRAAHAADALDSDAPAPPSLNLGAPILYLRTDVSFGVRAGGSVGHIAGVINEFARMPDAPILLSTDDIPTVDARVRTHLVPVREAFWNFRELPAVVMNGAFDEAIERVAGGVPIAFVYQRYSLDSYAGLRAARARQVPFVLEYNGSEIWMGRHWGRPLKHEALAERIERINLTRATMVVVVSRVMADDVIARGADASRVLVNPNGVDAERYRPNIDGRPVRTALGLGDRVVIGFIGTFGPWHGAEVLAHAFVDLRSRHPDLQSTTRLLLIGDGAGLDEVREILRRGGAGDAVSYAGLVPQADGPAHLAACDVLVSPHVPNPDGTPFFGSPTKLFEYMAMGRAIVASALDQIAEVLEDDRTARLVPPGDAGALADTLAALVRDSAARRRLGGAARARALDRHTWRQHVQRTIDRLSELAQETHERPVVRA